MKHGFLFLFVLFCTYNLVLGQVQDIETKFYDLFILNSNSFLSGKEDLRYHPARRSDSCRYAVKLTSNYHDIYREWIGDNNSKSNYQYDLGLNIQFPVELFEKDISVDLGFQREGLSSYINSNYDATEFFGRKWGVYSLKSNFLVDEETNKIGLGIKYSYGNNAACMTINKYPEDKSDALANKYYYSLLATAFGKDINYNLKGYEISYALEYNKVVNPSFNFGFNLYEETNNYDTGINYYGNVEKLEGGKNLSGNIFYCRYTFGFSCEYNFNKFIFRNLTSYSVPEYKLKINQDHLLQKNNVNLEISKLGDGKCTGKGLSTGIGVGYSFSNKITADVSYMIVFNKYTGDLFLSTPVLGYEILPIAHQVNADFSDNMRNHLLSFVLNHNVNSLWNYSVGLEYLSSNNNIKHNYKILTEFGFGNTREKNSEIIVGDIFRINLGNVFNISSSISLKLSFEQYIPILKKKEGREGTQQPTEPAIETIKSSKKSWGGSIYSLTLIYNYI